MSKSSSLSSPSIYPQEVIPELVKEVYVGANYDKLLALGADQLKEFRSIFRKEERRLTSAVYRMQHNVNALYNRTASDLARLARKYQSVPDDANPVSNEGEIFTNNGECIVFAPDATTFNNCGWCRYAKGFSSMGNCKAETICYLDPDAEVSGCFCACKLLGTDNSYLAHCVEYLKATEALLLAKRRDVRQKIAYLTRAIHVAEKEGRQ